MRGHHDIGPVEQGMIGRQRLGIGDVESRPPKVPGGESRHERVLIDDPSPGGVYEYEPGFIAANRLGEQPLVSPSGDLHRPLGRVEQPSRSSILSRLGVLRQERIEGHDLHAQRAGDRGNPSGDATEPHETQGFTFELDGLVQCVEVVVAAP